MNNTGIVIDPPLKGEWASAFPGNGKRKSIPSVRELIAFQAARSPQADRARMDEDFKCGIQ
jgi:hypothetical protein